MICFNKYSFYIAFNSIFGNNNVINSAYAVIFEFINMSICMFNLT